MEMRATIRSFALAAALSAVVRAGAAPAFSSADPATGTVWHVAADGDDANGGTSREDARRTLAAGAALLSAPGDTLLVHDGDYELLSTIAVSNGWRIVGEHGAAATRIRLSGPTASGATEGDPARYVAFDLSADGGAGAVDGFTFLPFDGVRRSATVVRNRGGTFSGCVVTNLGLRTRYSLAASAEGSSAVVRGCTFVDLWGGGRGGGVLEATAGALVEGCTFRDCSLDNSEYGGAIRANGNKTTVRNCLVANCSNTSRAGGINLGGGGWASTTVENCTVVGCSSASTTAAGGINLLPAAFTGTFVVRNCIVYGCTNAGGEANLSAGLPDVQHTATSPLADGPRNIALAAAPDFADPENGDFRVLSGPTIDAGLHLPWMDGATDLGGLPRVLGAAVDLGCHECASSSLRATIQPSDPVSIGAGSRIELEAVVTPAGATGLRFSWRVSDLSGRVVYSAAGLDLSRIVRDYGIGLYSVSLTVENAEHERFSTTVWDLFAVKPRTVWLASDAVPSYPYDTKANGFRSLADAVGFAENGMRIRVADGVHDASSGPIVLSRAVEIEGENGAGAATLFVPKAFTINHPAAVVRGVALLSEGKRGNDDPFSVAKGTLASCLVTNFYRGYGILSCGDGGLVTNCVIAGCRNDHRDCLVNIDEGSIVDSRIVGNASAHDSGSYNAILRITTGLARNCLVAGNKTKAGVEGGTCGFAISLENSGVVENCTVVGNVDDGTARNPAVGAKLATGTVRNCIVASNANLDGAAGVGGASGATTYTLCDAPPALSGAGCKICAPGGVLFRDPARGDYRLKGQSPARRAGVVLPWMKDATDIDGLPRLLEGRFVDMGCHQNQSHDTTILILR